MEKQLFDMFAMEQSISEASCLDIEEESLIAEYEVIDALTNAYAKQIEMQMVIEGWGPDQTEREKAELAYEKNRFAGAVNPSSTGKASILEKMKRILKAIGGFIIGIITKISSKLASAEPANGENHEGLISKLKKLAEDAHLDEKVKAKVDELKETALHADLNELIKKTKPERVLELIDRFARIEKCLNQIKSGVSDTGEEELKSFEKEPKGEEKTFDKLTLEAIIHYITQFKEYTAKLKSIKWRELQTDIQTAISNVEAKISELQKSPTPDKTAIANLNKTLKKLKSMQKDVAVLGNEILHNLNIGPKVMAECKKAISQAVDKVVNKAKSEGAKAIKNSYEEILNAGKKAEEM